VTSTNPHIGSTFENWLDEHGFREEATTAAIKAVIVHELVDAMRERGLSKTAMAARMQASRAQLDRLLDPENGGVTLETLQRAARIVGRELRVELV
jgi:antitoxin HicB